jgi:hypothetical protein
MYVKNVITKDPFLIDHFFLKKTIFRLIINLKNNLITITKKTVFKENNPKDIRYANFVELITFPKSKNIEILFKTSHNPAFLKKKNNIYIIGFFHFKFNTFLINEPINKKKSIINHKFEKRIIYLANTKFFIDKKMINILKNEINRIQTEDIIDNLKDIKQKTIIKQNIISNDNKNEDTYNQIKFINYQIKQIQKKLSLNSDI